MDKHYLKSSFREELIEHLFIGEMLKLSWRNEGCGLEVAKPEVDNQGYDLSLMQFEIIGAIENQETFATGKGIGELSRTRAGSPWSNTSYRRIRRRLCISTGLFYSRSTPQEGGRGCNQSGITN